MPVARREKKISNTTVRAVSTSLQFLHYGYNRANATSQKAVGIQLQRKSRINHGSGFPVTVLLHLSPCLTIYFVSGIFLTAGSGISWDEAYWLDSTSLSPEVS